MNIIVLQLNSATSVSNLESDYLETDSVSAKSDQGTRGSEKDKSLRMANGMEMVSNKRMRLANINAWTLRYNDEALESKVRSQRRYFRNIRILTMIFQFRQLREDMFKSNMICCYVLWLFIAICQAIILPE